MTYTHWLDKAHHACGANLQQFGHSSPEYVTCPKCLRVLDGQVAAGQQCSATPPGYPKWTCRLPEGHDGSHKRGPLAWDD